jgi:hypothetical protein
MTVDDFAVSAVCARLSADNVTIGRSHRISHLPERTFPRNLAQV